MTLFSKSKNLKELLRNPLKNLNPSELCIILHTTLLIRTDKSTSCVRIVYDASAKRDGPFLNDCLETGPNTLPQIIDILLRFQLNKIALISDIRKTFLNVSVPESDRDFLRKKSR